MDVLRLSLQETRVLGASVMILPPEATDTFSAASSQLFEQCFHPACCGDQGPADRQECISVPESRLLPFSVDHLSVLLYHEFFFGGLIFAATRI